MAYATIKPEKVKLIKRIAHGGFGTVYRGTWQNKHVAVKRVEREEGEHELSFLSQLDHPNIVKLLGIVDNELECDIVLEFYSGGNLRNYLDAHRGVRLSINVFYSWAKQVTRPIGYLKTRGVVHKDVKSQNYLISEENILKLCDFGLAKNIDATIASATERATYPYMAPELLKRSILSPTYDIFALAVVIWELLTTDSPFEGCESSNVMYRICVKNERLPIPAGCPVIVADLMRQCWETDWKRRPSVERILAMLDAAEKEALKKDLTPAEILARGPDAYRVYEDAIAEGKRAIYRTRLMLVGQERVGKTSLMKTLTNQPFDKGETSTDGIEVSDVCSIDIVHATSWSVKKETASTSMFVEAVGTQMAKNLGAFPKQKDPTVTSATRGMDSTKTTDKAEHGIMQRPSDHIPNPMRRDPNLSFDQQAGSWKMDVQVADRSMVTDEPVRTDVSIPREIISAIDNTLERETEPLTFSIWDFAGQDLYYTTHQVFLSQRSVYVAVFDLRRDLVLPRRVQDSSTPAMMVKWLMTQSPFQDSERHGRGSRQSELDILDFWLRSIYTFVAPDNRHVAEQGLRSPPIFIVGTHRGRRNRTRRVQRQFEVIKQFIRGKCYEQHVVQRFYEIENSVDNYQDSEVIQLRQHIEDIARKQPYMGEEIPIRWLQFEESINDQILQGIKVLELREVKQLPGMDSFSSTVELQVMLQFYHDLGHIVYFADGGPELRNLVVLDPHWLIDVFRRIITWKHDLKQGHKQKAEMEQLLEFGILDDKLASYLWRDLISGQLDKELQKKYLILVMDKFDLLCERLPPKQLKVDEWYTKSYYVPARLKPGKSTVSIARTIGPSTVFFIDFMGFLPDGLFNRLLTRCARWSQEQGGLEPKLRYRHAVFYADDYHEFQLDMLSAEEATAKVTIYPSSDIAGTSRTFNEVQRSLATVSNKVRIFLETTVEDLKKIWMKGIRFNVVVRCPACTTEQHYLDLNDCLQYSFVRCERKQMRVDTKRIQERFITSSSSSFDGGISSQLEKMRLHDSEDVSERSTIRHDGGELRLTGNGIHLSIPEGAIPEGNAIDVTLSMPLQREPPPLDDDHVLVTPIVRCEPDGVRFLKPVVLTLPCCASELSERDITVWTKSKSAGTSGWVKIFEVQDVTSPSREVISVGKDYIQLGLWHFSDDTISANAAISLGVMVIQNPTALDDAHHAFITVYAAPSTQMTMIEGQIESKGLQVAIPKTIRFLPDKRNLKIHISDVKPNHGWEPDKEKGEIAYEDIQSKETYPCRQFRFEKKDGAEKVSLITGALSITQDDKETNGYYFSSDMLNHTLQEQGGAKQKRKMPQADDGLTKRTKGIAEMVSDKDITDVAFKAKLSHDQLRILYTELDIPPTDVEVAEKSADVPNFKIQAVKVLQHWRSINGRGATRQAIIDALEEYTWKEAKDILEEKWHMI